MKRNLKLSLNAITIALVFTLGACGSKSGGGDTAATQQQNYNQVYQQCNGDTNCINQRLGQNSGQYNYQNGQGPNYYAGSYGGQQYFQNPQYNQGCGCNRYLTNK